MNNLFFNSVAKCGFALLSTVLTLSSCSNSEEVTNLEELETNRRVPVSVHVSEFSFSMEDLPGTRSAVTPASYEELDVITLAFYDGTTEVFNATQLRSDASAYTTFGDFSCDLPIGNYTMVVIGRDDKGLLLRVLDDFVQQSSLTRSIGPYDNDTFSLPYLLVCWHFVSLRVLFSI